MQRPVVTLRAARPTYAEGLVFARYANEASEEFMRMFLGPQFEAVMARAFLQPDHDLSWQNVTFAERDQRIAGMMLAYTETQHRDSSLQPLRIAAGRVRLRLRLIELISGPLMRLNDLIEEGDFYLQFVAVDQGLRSAGIGTRLMEALEQRARAAGSARLALDVSKNNVVARSFYEHLGWYDAWEWPKSRFLPTLSVRMMKDL